MTLPPLPKYTTRITASLALIVIFLYEVPLPARLSSDYINRLSSSQQLANSFKELSRTTKLAVFNNPDASIEVSEKNLAAVEASIQASKDDLNILERTADSLRFPTASGYTSNAHNARVKQEQTRRVIAESRDVINQYSQLANFLKVYKDTTAIFINATSDVNNVSNLDTLNAEQIKQQATKLYATADSLRQTNPPGDYQKVADEFRPQLTQAADGFDTLSSGLLSGNEAEKSAGINQIESATETYYSRILGLIVSTSQNSYILRQVQELPNKIKSLAL